MSSSGPLPRSVLIVRADSPIGRSTTQVFEARGDRVHAVAGASLGQEARREAIQAAGATGGLSVLVVPPPAGTTTTSTSPTGSVRASFDATLREAFFWCQDAARSMTAGQLILAAPCRGLGAPEACPANPIEGAFVALVRLLAVELAPREFAVNALCPLAHDAEPSSVAAALAFLASGDASYMTGALLPVHGPAPSGGRGSDERAGPGPRGPALGRTTE